MAADDEAVRRQFWKVARTFLLGRRPPNPNPALLPLATAELAHPTVAEGQLRMTWIGHASVLIQLPGLNILTDPVWSERCSPFPSIGPRRFVPPPLSLDELPRIHAVLLSHDHFDHLDRPTVEALHARFGDELTWVTPIGYRDWFEGLGINGVVERDWWEEAPLPGGRFKAVAVPARHWTRRRPWGTNLRLWCGWVVAPVGGVDGSSASAGPKLWFAGDSGYCPAFAEIGERLGPFDASLVPIGAYEPRWFMGPAHMNPEEAVKAYVEAGGRGACVPIHWGTFRLTLEDPLEPPVRFRAAWGAAGLPPEALHVPRHGETLRLGRADGHHGSASGPAPSSAAC